MISISLDKLAFIIERAREFDAEAAPVNEQERAGSTDEEIDDILEDSRRNPTYTELRTAIRDLNVDERSELVALVWIGRGDFAPQEWSQALAAARERHNGREVGYLAGTPLLADYLEEALSQFGISGEALESGRF
jgi:hypothetical protein